MVPPRESVDRVLDAEKVTRKALVAGVGADPDVVRKVTEKLATALEVQGFLVAVLPEERLQHTAVLYLLAAGNAVAEPGEVTFGEAASYLRFISKIDFRATVYRPWSGLITADTLLHDGVPVLRTVPGSPAAQAGIEPGEVVTGAEGKPIKGTAALLALVEQKKPEGSLVDRRQGSLGLAGGGADPGPVAPGDTALRAHSPLQQGHDGPAPTDRRLPGDGAGGVRLAEPGALRHALPGLRDGPRTPHEGQGRAAAAAGHLAGDGPLLHGGGPRPPQLPPAGHRGIQGGRCLQGRDPLQQRRAFRGSPGHAAERPRPAHERRRPSSSGHGATVSRSSSRSGPTSSRSAATKPRTSASTSLWSRATTPASSGGTAATSCSISARRTAPASTGWR